MKKVFNRLAAALDVLFKKDVIVLTVEKEYAVLWSSIDDDDKRIGHVLKWSGEYLMGDLKIITFEDQKK